jgi:hypothetical protein
MQYTHQEDTLSRDTRSDESERARKLRHLRELIAALDRRVPHVERLGEIQIAHEPRALRERAVQRLAELEASADDLDDQGSREFS